MKHTPYICNSSIKLEQLPTSNILIFFMAKFINIHLHRIKKDKTSLIQSHSVMPTNKLAFKYHHSHFFDYRNVGIVELLEPLLYLTYM